jgi:hypothetical protein
MTTALARRFKVDVSTDGTTWVALKGIDDLNPQINPNLQSADDYDSNGFSAFEKTMIGWVLTVKALRKTVSNVFDAGQELVRAAQLQFGDQARIYVRWYDRNGAPEAFSGQAIVGYTASKTGVADLDEVTITLTGDGALSSITNPYAAAAIPVITVDHPVGCRRGCGIVQIKGTGFIGTVPTTGVKFGGVNATSWIVVSDQLIVAVLPAGSAGLQTVLVTNGAGGSTATNNYTRA